MKLIKSIFKAGIFASILGVSNCVFANAQKVAVENKFEFAPAGAVELRGMYGRALDASLKGDMLSSDIDMLVVPFQKRLETRYWDCEFWGKWFTGALLAYDYSPSMFFQKRLKKSVDDICATQDSEGSITTYTKEHEFKLNPKGFLTEADKNSWDLWGRKYTLLGLLDYYRRTGEKKYLDAACRHTDYIMERVCEGKKDIVQIGCWFGCASTSILEPVVLLYRASGDSRYLDYANWIVKSWSTSPLKPDLLNKALRNTEVFDMFEHPDPKYDGYLGGGKSKAYEMASCFEGLAELYRQTGEQRYFDAVKNHARSIRDTEINVVGSGSIEERWINGKFVQTNRSKKWDETCVTATWIKLCSQLLRLTGDVKYADDIELAASNALIGGFLKDGTWWTSVVPMDGVKTYNKKAAATKKSCCSTNGPRGLFLLPKLAYMSAPNGVVVNFYENSAARLNIPNGGTVDMVMSDVDFSEGGDVKIEISGLPKDGANFDVLLRIPYWADKCGVFVNGKDAGAAEIGKYHTISRQWRNGDKIALKMDIPVRIAKDPAGSGLICLQYGPYTLSQDKRFEKNFDKPVDLKIKNGRAVGKFSRLKDAEICVDVETQDGDTRRFIDYASAGKTWDEKSAFNTWFGKK